LHRKRVFLFFILCILVVMIFGVLYFRLPELNGNSTLTTSPSFTIISSSPTFFQPAVTSTQEQTTFYVSPKGDDDNPGTIDSPWFTIQYAVDQVTAGDTIYLREGTYPGSITISKSGTLEKPITLKRYMNESVTISGGMDPTFEIYGDNWIIDGFTMVSDAEYTINLGASYTTVLNSIINGQVYIWGNHNTFENNEIVGANPRGYKNGITEDGPDSFNNYYYKNLIHGFTQRGIWSVWLTHDNVYEENEIFNITGEKGICLDLDGASSVNYRSVIRGNIIHECENTGIELENSYQTLVENNLVYTFGLEGIQVISYKGCTTAGENNQFGDPDGDCRGNDLGNTLQQNIIYDSGRVGGIVAYQASGVKVYNNTVVGGASVALFIKGTIDQSNLWDVRGNIFANNARGEISIQDPKSLIEENNLVFHPKSLYPYELRNSQNEMFTFNEWQSRFQLGRNTIATDPLFVNVDTFNFHLQPGSPAIDTGIDLGITLDFDGEIRPAGVGFDLGAYEFQP
jgi:parallel beta-helix repeat protein